MLRFLGCVTVILILHCTGKNAILGKLKLTAVYLTGFRRSRKKMELKQLEYFTIVCEKGSFSQAAECLYTSQPNVSKVISSLEKELGRKLVERSSRGLRITPYGETVRDYAKVILKHASLISSMATHHNGKKFTLATYPSNMITNLLVDFYRRVHCRASGGQCRRGQQLGGQRADGNRHRLYCTASTGGVSAYPWT